MKLRLRHQMGPVEDSVAMRLIVGVAVEFSIAAVVAQGAVGPAVAVATLILGPLGYLSSYRRRHRANVGTKVALTIGVLLVTSQFLHSVSGAGSVDQARVPLATLFLWVQALHSLDVPRRRDLAFSMASSLILMAEAGSLSLSTSFLWFLAPWAVLASAWLFLSGRPNVDRATTVVSVRRVGGSRPRLSAATSAARALIVALVASVLVFLAMPRVPASLIHTPPFSLRHASPVSNFDGSVSNPRLPVRSGDARADFQSGAYPGFSDVVDLEARGRLSDEIAFRVRSTQPSLWRAETFDTFDGTRWTSSDKTTLPLSAGGGGVGAQVPASVIVANRTADSVPLTQTFYIDTPQPNVVFAATGATQVYFPAGGLRVDRSGSIRSPILLDPGMVYSVVSSVPVVDDGELRSAERRMPRSLRADLQLPADLPGRVGELARHITAGATDEVGRVDAVQSWIRANTRYDLHVPRDPAGVDAVDRFLFDDRRGFCEQIASAMAVLLRTEGIPTRLVTGYGPGSRNLLTGYFEVRQSDAHAWVEVFYPGIGWIPYDPTFGVPRASSSLSSWFVSGPVFAAIARFVGRTVPAPLKRAVIVIGRAGARAIRSWPIALAVAILASSIVTLARRRRRRARAGPRPTGAGAAFADLVEALRAAGHGRSDHETPGEYLATVRGDRSFDGDVADAAELVVRTFERECFAASKPDADDVGQARLAAARVRELVGKR